MGKVLKCHNIWPRSRYVERSQIRSPPKPDFDSDAFLQSEPGCPIREVPEQPPVGTMDEWLGLIGWLGAVNLVGSTDGFEAVNGDVTVRRPS